MSGKNINLNERRGGENKVSENSPQSETLYIPQEVFEGEAVKADVRDDNWAMAEEMDGIIGFEPYDKEKDFVSPSDEEIVNKKKFEDERNLSRILERAKALKVGLGVVKLYGKAA